jgi:hypothetical protein
VTVALITTASSGTALRSNASRPRRRSLTLVVPANRCWPAPFARSSDSE